MLNFSLNHIANVLYSMFTKEVFIAFHRSCLNLQEAILEEKEKRREENRQSGFKLSFLTIDFISIYPYPVIAPTLYSVDQTSQRFSAHFRAFRLMLLSLRVVANFLVMAVLASSTYAIYRVVEFSQEVDKMLADGKDVSWWESNSVRTKTRLMNEQINKKDE